MVILHMSVFFQPSIYYRTAAANSYVVMVGATPYSLFWKVPWVNEQLASSDLTFRTRKKAAGAKIVEQGRFGVILIPLVTR
jgi:hypothetical protein